MGLFSAIGNFFRKITGRNTPKEIPSLPDTTIKRTDPNTVPEITLQEKDLEIKEEKIPQAELVDPTPIKEKNVLKTEYEATLTHPQTYKKPEIRGKVKWFERVGGGSHFVTITDKNKDSWEKELNPEGKVITTPFYNGYQELMNNRYDIYRNIIMKAIQNDTTAQKIFSSGIIDERIVAHIRMKVQTSNGQTKIIEQQVQGISPERILQKGDGGIYSLVGRTIAGHEMRYILGDILGADVEGQVKEGDYTNKVLEVQVAFNYA